MTKRLKTRSILIFVVILTGLFFQAPQTSLARVVEKFDPLWEQKASEPEPAVRGKLTNNLGMKFVYVPLGPKGKPTENRIPW